MLTCITCSKQKAEDEEEESVRGTPTSTKEAVKGLTSQIKDMALKVSGTSKQGKASTPGGYKRGQWPYADFDAISEGVSYTHMQPGSSSSTPAWDFTRRGARKDLKMAGLFGGNMSPGRLDSISSRPSEVEAADANEPKEWMAQVEPGVHITFVTLPNGGNDMKRIRFSREMFNKWQAQRWWGENYDRIMELYNVQRFNQQDPNTPSRSEAGRDSSYSRLGSARESPMMTPSINRDWTPRTFKPSGYQNYFPSEPQQQPSHQHYGAGSRGGPKGEMSAMDPSRMTTSSRDETSASISSATDFDSEWIEEDQPGVYITIRQLADGTRELRRVRFSREMFGETNAKLWWEENRDRIQAQYL